MEIMNVPTGSLGVNTYLVTDEATRKAFMVDPGGFSNQIVKKIKDEGIELEYIILTHGHADHIGGISEFKAQYPDVKVLSHVDEKEMLADPAFNMSTSFGMPVSVTPDVAVEDGQELNIGNMELKFIHTPGHSPGGMCIYAAKEGVLFSGDTLFCQSIGRTDFPGCSFNELISAIRNKLFVLPDDTNVLPGHMGPTSIEFEKRSNPFV